MVKILVKLVKFEIVEKRIKNNLKVKELITRNYYKIEIKKEN